MRLDRWENEGLDRVAQWVELHLSTGEGIAAVRSGGCPPVDMGPESGVQWDRRPRPRLSELRYRAGAGRYGSRPASGARSLGGLSNHPLMNNHHIGNENRGMPSILSPTLDLLNLPLRTIYWQAAADL